MKNEETPQDQLRADGISSIETCAAKIINICLYTATPKRVVLNNSIATLINEYVTAKLSEKDARIAELEEESHEWCNTATDKQIELNTLKQKADVMSEALQNIIDPVKYLTLEAEKEGAKISIGADEHVLYDLMKDTHMAILVIINKEDYMTRKNVKPDYQPMDTFKGFKISVIEHPVLQDGSAVLHLSHNDYKSYMCKMDNQKQQKS